MNLFPKIGIIVSSLILCTSAQEPQEVNLNGAVPDSPAPGVPPAQARPNKEANKEATHVERTAVPPRQPQNAKPPEEPSGPRPAPQEESTETPIPEGFQGRRIKGINNLNMGNNIPIEIQLELQTQLDNQDNDSLFFRKNFTRKEIVNILTKFQKLTQNEMESRILQVEAAVSGNTRKTEDPFGLGIDGIRPKPPVEATQDADELARLANQPTLQNAIGTLKIRGVFAPRKEFLAEGGQNVYEGDRIRIVFQGTQFMARVERVEETRIVFRDRVTGVRAVLPVNLGPPEDLLKKGGPQTGFLTPMPPIEPVQGRDD
jgi:hypothetical protein